MIQIFWKIFWLQVVTVSQLYQNLIKANFKLVNIVMYALNRPLFEIFISEKTCLKGCFLFIDPKMEHLTGSILKTIHQNFRIWKVRNFTVEFARSILGVEFPRKNLTQFSSSLSIRSRSSILTEGIAQQEFRFLAEI